MKMWHSPIRIEEEVVIYFSFTPKQNVARVAISNDLALRSKHKHRQLVLAPVLHQDLECKQVMRMGLMFSSSLGVSGDSLPTLSSVR